MIDTHSDPRTPNGAYADNLITRGFVNHEKFGALLKDTLPIRAINVDDYDAVWVDGDGGPLVTFKDDTALYALIAAPHRTSAGQGKTLSRSAACPLRVFTRMTARQPNIRRSKIVLV